MKKIISVVLIFVFMFSLSLPCFAASSAAVSFAVSECIEFLRSSISSYNSSIAARTEAARTFYFYKICNDDISGGISVFDSTGKKFTDEILKFYFDRYIEAYNGTLDIYDSDGDIFIQAAGYPDTPFSLRLLCFCEYHIMQEDDGLELTFNVFKNYYNTMLARYLLENGETATDPAPGKSGLEIAPAYVTSDELIEGIEKDNSNLSPKSTDLFLNSYRTQPYLYDTYLHNWGYEKFSYPRYVLFDNGVDERLKDLYFIPFGLDYDGTFYYLPFQFHFYFDSYDGTNADMALKMEVFIHSSLGYQSFASFTDVFEFNSDNMPYQIAFNAGPTPPQLFVYPDEDSYINQTPLRYSVLSKMGDKELFYTADKSDYKRYSNGAFNNFSWRYDKHIVSGEVMYSGDFGFLCSKSKISTVYDFDTSKIGKGQVVTINGDTIYNYTITNPETGDSSKFGDYITNNYTYITNNNGGSSGGTVGGKVEVGGKIDVGGSVAVDVNVNVNGAGGTSLNPSDFTSGDTVDTKKYFDSALEMSENTQNFFGDFFSFLPPELLALILFGLTMAIVCRVGGR